MKQWQLQAPGLESLRLEEVDPPGPPGAGEVTVRLHAASLNYRDVLILESRYDPSQTYPVIPLSDGAGEVVATGEGVTGFRAGDRVAGAFSQTWLDGVPDYIPRHGSLGGALTGVAQAYRTFPAHGLVHVPPHLDSVQASTLPCAAVTAWHALYERGPLRPGDSVLLQGSGGVSLFALQLACAGGARVVHLTGSPGKEAILRDMGADHVINYRTTPDWDKAVLEHTDGRGVDRVVDVGGPDTLPKALSCTRHGGRISMVGVLAGGRVELQLLAAIARNISLDAIFVGSRTMFQRLNRALQAHQLVPVVDRVFPFEELPAAVGYLRSGAHTGKIALRIAPDDGARGTARG